MVIGITGRGGTGKSTLAKKIVEDYKNFIHIEVDELIEQRLSSSSKLIERANKEVGTLFNKNYTYNDIIQAYFSDLLEDRMLQKIFNEELNRIINEEVEKLTNKNIVIEHFLLNKFDVYSKCDLKIKLIASLEERISRIEKRGNMAVELYKKVDNRNIVSDDAVYDFMFNISEFQKELISVIVPVYNGEAYINETIECILNQSYHNFELIIVNDGSTDKTASILEHYREIDDRIKIITTENLNVSNARNTGLKSATGEYVAFIDSDDLIDKNYLSTLYNAIKYYNSDFSSSAISVEKMGKIPFSTHKEDFIGLYDDVKNEFLKLNITFSVWGKLFKRELIKDIQFENISCFEDFIYIWEVVKRCSKACVIGNTKYHYIERNKNSITHSFYSDINKVLYKHAKKVLVDMNNSELAYKYYYGCLLHNIILYSESLKNPLFEDKYQDEIIEYIKELKSLEEYKFQLLKYENIDINELFNSILLKNKISCIGVLWNTMSEYVDEAIEDIKKYASIDKIIDFRLVSNLGDFIKSIYPYYGDEAWKLQYKIKNLYSKYGNNNITILYLTIPKGNLIFNERKNTFVYENVSNLKDFIRSKYSKKIENYQFDNVFHMTDDEYEYYFTDYLIDRYLIFNRLRENGYVNLDMFDIKTTDLGGKRKKFEFNDYIFKCKKEGTYEDFSELFNEELLKMCGLKSATYDLALHDNKKGVFSKKFTSSISKLITGYEIISEVLNSSDINEIMQYNNLEDIEKLIKLYFYKNNYNIEQTYNIMEELKKLFIYDIVTLQYDRHLYNWGILVTNNTCILAPIYDNSNMANINKINIEFDKGDILLLGNKNDSRNPDELVYEYYDEYMEKIFDILINHVDEIFSKIELKIQSEIPDEFKQIIFKIINRICNIKKNLKCYTKKKFN